MYKEELKFHWRKLKASQWFSRVSRCSISSKLFQRRAANARQEIYPLNVRFASANAKRKDRIAEKGRTVLRSTSSKELSSDSRGAPQICMQSCVPCRCPLWTPGRRVRRKHRPPFLIREVAIGSDGKGESIRDGYGGRGSEVEHWDRAGKARGAGRPVPPADVLSSEKRTQKHESAQARAGSRLLNIMRGIMWPRTYLAKFSIAAAAVGAFEPPARLEGTAEGHVPAATNQDNAPAVSGRRRLAVRSARGTASAPLSILSERLIDRDRRVHP